MIKKRTAWNKGKKEKVFTPWSEKERIGHMKVLKTGKNSPNWKGDLAGYWALHDWIEKQKGKPSCCEMCGITKAKKFEWANKSHQYRRDTEDWFRLCVRCHHKYDDIAKKSWATKKLI